MPSDLSFKYLTIITWEILTAVVWSVFAEVETEMWSNMTLRKELNSEIGHI